MQTKAFLNGNRRGIAGSRADSGPERFPEGVTQNRHQESPMNSLNPARAQPSVPVLRPTLLDRIEQAVLIFLSLSLAIRVMREPGMWSWLVLASECLILVFVLFRHPTDRIATSPRDWLLAYGGSAAPLLIQPEAAVTGAFVPVGATLFLAGNFISLWAKLALRRSFGVAPANRGLKLNGPYAIVRHPMYAGYLISHIGIFGLMPSWHNLAAYLACWSIQIMRLMAEERLLSEDERYVRYRQDVRYRFFPGIW